MERSLTNSHFVNHAAKGPKIHARRRNVLIEHLGGDVQGCADEGVGLASFSSVHRRWLLAKERVAIVVEVAVAFRLRVI